MASRGPEQTEQLSIALSVGAGSGTGLSATEGAVVATAATVRASLSAAVKGAKGFLETAAGSFGKRGSVFCCVCVMTMVGASTMGGL